MRDPTPEPTMYGIVQEASQNVVDFNFLQSHCTHASHEHHPAGHHAISKQLPKKTKGKRSAASKKKSMVGL